MGPQIIHIFRLAEFRCFEGASLTCRIVDLKLFIVLYLAKILSVISSVIVNISIIVIYFTLYLLNH
jgi:hypothetical protein